MKKLVKYLRPYRAESVLGPLFKLLEATLELLVPLIMADIIDVGIAAGDTAYIVKKCLLLAGLGVGGFVFSTTAQYFAAKAATGFTADVRHDLFAQIQRLSFAQQDRLGTSTAITRMISDMNQVQTGLNLTLRLLLRSPFVVFGAMVMAFTVDKKAALAFAVAIPVLFAVVFAIMLSCIPLYKKVQGRLDKVLGKTRGNLNGVRVIRAFGLEERETEEFDAENSGLFASQRFVGRLSALLNPVTYVIINLAVVAVLRIGGGRVDAGILTQGAVIALYNYMSQILVELIKLANLILNITKALACADRVSAVLALEPGMEAGTAALDTGCETAVAFENVAFRYPGAEEDALESISFTVPKGQTVGIIGGTGSGKSTLVNLIPRLYDRTAGAVRLFGTDVRDCPVEQVRNLVGIVPQKALLFSGTVRENLRWGDEKADDSELLAAMEAAQIDKELDFKVEQAGRNLSGGQKQRLTVARALVRKPEILILDDSASALDFATEAKLRKTLQNLPWKPTVFIVSQRTASIQHADQILVLDDGRLAASGTHAELLQSCTVYREIYDSQFRKEDAV